MCTTGWVDYAQEAVPRAIQPEDVFSRTQRCAPVLTGYTGFMGNAPLANLWFRQLLKADCQTGLIRNVFVVKLGEKRKQCYLERVNLNGFHSTNDQAFRKQPEPKQEKWATL